MFLEKSSDIGHVHFLENVAIKMIIFSASASAISNWAKTFRTIDNVSLKNLGI